MRKLLSNIILSLLLSVGTSFAASTEQRLYEIGLENFRNRNYSAAADYLGQAADLDPRNVWARYYHVYSIVLLGKRNEASKWLPKLKSISNTPQYQQLVVQLNAGMALPKPQKKEPQERIIETELGSYKPTLGEVMPEKRSATKQPSKPKEIKVPEIEQAKEYIDSEKYFDAESVLKKFIAKNGKNIEARQLLGLVYYNNKRYNECITEFGKAIEYGSKDFQTHFMLAQSFENTQNNEKALVWYEKANSINSNDCIALLAIADLYAAKSDFKKAKDLYESIIKKDSNLVDAQVGLIRIELDQGYVEKALEKINETLGKFNDNAKARFLKANILLKQREYTFALEEAQVAFDNNPSNIEYKVFCSLVKIRNFMVKEAKKELLDILKTYPDNVYALSTLGEAYLTEGNTNDGRKALLQAEKIKKIPATSQLQALIEFYDGKFEEAEKYYKEFCKRSGDSPESLLEYAEFNEAKDDQKASISIYQKIINKYNGTPFASKALAAIEKLKQKN